MMYKSLKKIIKSFTFSIWYRLLSKSKQKYIFIMAHPRSGSSLLMHLLTNNKDIIGYGEYYTKYDNIKSLKKFEFDIRRKTKAFFSEIKFITNQIVSNHITENFELFDSNKMKYIFLIRKPQESISSLMLLSENKLGKSNQEDALEIYLNRLSYLKKIIDKIPLSNRYFLTYDMLVENSEYHLNKLTQFLNLKKLLVSNYKNEKYSQVWGDPSKNIKKGEIFKTNSKQIKIKKDILLKAENAYQSALKNLANS